MADDAVVKSEKDQLEEKLNDLLIENTITNVGISIRGSWGIGKSQFWNEFSKRFKKGKYAYISLFGKTTIEGIRQEILLKISARSKIITNLKGLTGSSSAFGVDVGSLLSVLDKSDFSNITICFDDFERVSGKIDLKDIMGLIAELKEQKGCNIVIINNNDQLKDSDNLNNVKIYEYIDASGEENIGKTVPKYNITRSNNRDIFNLYSEKIIDFEFEYSPTIAENFATQSTKIEVFNQDSILRFLESSDNHDGLSKSYNIRLLKKYVSTLELFDFLGSEDLPTEILDSISSYIYEKIYTTTLSLQDFNFIPIDLLASDIDKAVSSSFLPEKTDFLQRVKTLKERTDDKEFREKIFAFHIKYLYDLSINDEDYGKELFDLMKQKEENLTNLIGLGNFYTLNTELKSIYKSHITEIDLFADEVLKRFVDSTAEKDSLRSDLFRAEFKEQFKDFPNVQSYIDAKKHEQESGIIDDITIVTATLKKIRIGSGWSPQQVASLGAIQTKTHLDFMTSVASH